MNAKTPSRHETLAPALNQGDRAILLTGYSVDLLKQSKTFIDAAKQTDVQHIVHIGASGAPTKAQDARRNRCRFSFQHSRRRMYAGCGDQCVGSGY